MDSTVDPIGNMWRALREGNVVAALLAKSVDCRLRGQENQAKLCAQTARFLCGGRQSKLRIGSIRSIARSYFAEKQYLKAIALYDELISIEIENCSEAWVHKGDALMALGRKPEAAEVWKAAEASANLSPEGFEKYSALANLASRKKNWMVAFEMHQRQLEFCTGLDAMHRCNVLNDLAKCAFYLNRHTEARNWALQAVDCSPKYIPRVTANKWAALASLALGNLEDARASYEAALLTATEIGDLKAVNRAKASLIGVELKLGHLDEALSLAKALYKSNSEPSAAMGLAHCYIFMGQFEDGLEALRKALTLQAERVWTEVGHEAKVVMYLECARVCAKLGHFEEAESLISSFDENTEESAKARHKIKLTRALVECFKGDFDTGRRLMSELMEEFDSILSNLIEAKGWLSLMAQAFLMLNDFSQAKIVLNHWDQVGMFPVQRPRYYLFLGECEEGLGNSDAARKAYEEAIGIGIETFEAKTARDRLAKLN